MHIEELMVQMQVIIYLKNNCFDNNKLQNCRKQIKKLLNSFELSKKYNLKFSGRPLIGQDEFLGVLQFVETCW